MQSIDGKTQRQRLPEAILHLNRIAIVYVCTYACRASSAAGPFRLPGSHKVLGKKEKNGAADKHKIG